MLSPILASANLVQGANSGASLKGSSARPDAETEFLAYAQMSPMDRMRAAVLGGMGLTEDDVKGMSADDRRKVEETIKQLIKQAAEKNANKTGQLVDASV